MKRIILISIFSCFMVSVAFAQNSRGSVERYGTSLAQQDIKADREFKQRKRAYITYNEVEQARYAMEAAQRKVNDLVGNRQAKIEKFSKSLEKISNPDKRASELKKYLDKLEKEYLKAQNQFENAQTRYYNALSRYDSYHL